MGDNSKWAWAERLQVGDAVRAPDGKNKVICKKSIIRVDSGFHYTIDESPLSSDIKWFLKKIIPGSPCDIELGLDDGEDVSALRCEDPIEKYLRPSTETVNLGNGENEKEIVWNK